MKMKNTNVFMMLDYDNIKKNINNQQINKTIITKLCANFLEQHIINDQITKRIDKASCQGYISCNGYSYSFPMKNNAESSKNSFLQIQFEIIEGYICNTEFTFWNKNPLINEKYNNVVFPIVYLFEGIDPNNSYKYSRFNKFNKPPVVPEYSYIHFSETKLQLDGKQPFDYDKYPLLKLSIEPVRDRISRYLTKCNYHHRFWLPSMNAGNVVEILFEDNAV